MENFLGLYKDAVFEKTPEGRWNFAKNILLSKRAGSISNEEGFKSLAPIPGNYIGHISTNEETVIFSVDNGYSCIGIITTSNPSIYVPKIRSLYLGFKINRPIEGVYYYNYNKELIIIFCDGVFLDSNVPKLINLTSIGINLTPSLEFVNASDVDLLNLSNATREAQIAIEYGATINLPLDVVFITYTYVLSDDISTTGYYPAHHLAYPVYQYTNKVQRTIKLSLTELDPNYEQLKIGLIVVKDNALVAYESPILPYVGTSFDLEITSISQYEETTVDKLVIPTIVYNRVKSMTIQNNTLVFGNVATQASLDIQKYINLLEVGIKMMTSEDANKKHTHPTLCPDEVYALYIQCQLTSSEWTEAYPLIGPKAASANEFINADIPYLTALGLSDGTNGVPPNVYKKFHIENSGGYVLPPPFDENNPLHNELRWGYWENDEFYPNDNRFNSTIDYNGNPLSGDDLRGTPIRYFRVPGLDNIVKKTPCILGKLDYNINPFGSRFFGLVPRFGIYIKNFDTVIPNEIKDRLQGFRLLAVKRKAGEYLVEDIPFIKRAQYKDQQIEGNNITSFYPIFESPVNDAYKYTKAQHGLNKVWSSTLGIYKASITPKIIKCNYGVGNASTIAIDEGGTSFRGFTNNGTMNDPTVLPMTDYQKYANIVNIDYLPANNMASNTLLIEECIKLEAHNYLQGDGGFSGIPNRWNPFNVYHESDGTKVDLKQWNNISRVYENVSYGSIPQSSSFYSKPYWYAACATLLNLKKTLYLGFNPKEFICLGRVSISNTSQPVYDNGDIYTNNSLSLMVTCLQGSSILGRVKYTQQWIRGIWGVANNSLLYTPKQVPLDVIYDVDDDNSQFSWLQNIQYTQNVFNNESYKTLNDLIVVSTANVNSKTINYFPFRVARSSKILNENLQTDNVRVFKANDYYEMPNNKGEVIAVRGTNKQLFIQQKYSLFVAFIKDRLNTNESTTYLGEGDIFDRSPEEIKYNSDKGYIGCTNQIACIIIPNGLVVLDQLKGNVFIVSGGSYDEITKKGISTWAQDNFNTTDYYTHDRFGYTQPVDNPYTGIGHLIGYDEQYNRILLTKKHYIFKYPNLVGSQYQFDGEYYYENGERLNFDNPIYFIDNCQTLSYSIDDNTFVSEHDYFPNGYLFNTYGLFSIAKTTLSSVYKLYQHNIKSARNGTYYDNITYRSYVDLIFNNRLDLSKQYQAIEWGTVVETVEGVKNYNKTIDKVVVYSDYQASIEIPVTQFNTSRNVEGIWNLNEFRDVVVDRSLPIIDSRGRLNTANLNNNRSYFEKSFFIGTFVIIRLIMENSNSDDVYINVVNVKSRISKR